MAGLEKAAGSVVSKMSQDELSNKAKDFAKRVIEKKSKAQKDIPKVYRKPLANSPKLAKKSAQRERANGLAAAVVNKNMSILLS